MQTARSYVHTTPEIDAAFDAAVRWCKQFSQEIAERGLLYSATAPTSQQARELALGALRELEERLADARPSETAIHLGLGW
jgi:hypothetical protein